MSVPDGSNIGPYEITERIGAGGMATVYKAYQAKLDRHVAIKVMHESFTQDSSFLNRFEREARIVARLDHPNIVPVYDYDEIIGRPYIVMKFVEGQTLKRLLEANALNEEDKLKVLTVVADALTYAHEKGILHRDVKPSNILIDERGIAYLTDFGLARITTQGASTMSVDTMLGTPHYISPEQAQADVELDARTDVYSLGVILYEMMTGRVPFMSDTSYAIVHDHIYKAPLPPSDFNPNITREAEAVILKALAKSPADRYPTPNALIEAYKAALHGSVQQHGSRLSDSVVSKVESLNEEERERQKEYPTFGEEVKMFFDALGGQSRPEESISQRMEAWGEAFGARMEERFDGDKSSSNFHIEIGDKDDDDEKEEDLSHLTPEQRIRYRAEKRVRERREKVGAIFTQLFFFGIINFVFLNADDWIGQMMDEGRLISPSFFLWIFFIFWGFGIIAQLVEYYNEFGPGYRARENQIQKEMERERRRLGESFIGSKAKNEDLERQVRLTGDGEFTESFIDEIDGRHKRKNR